MKEKDRNEKQRQNLAAFASKTDGRDIEFSEELADHDDKEAQARSKAADRRAKQ